MNTSASPRQSKRRLVVAASACAAALLACAAAYATFSPELSRRAADKTTVAAKAPVKVAAVVNGKEIFDSELAPVIAQGVDRAIAVDRYVNKVLAAEMARRNYALDAEEALRGAEREVLAQLYISRRTGELQAGISDEEVRAFYESNVKAEDYARYKVKFLMTADEKEANEVAGAIAAGRSTDVAARFKPAKDGGDGFVLAPELPYGLGNVVRALKKGDYSKPVILRNGFFILYLEDAKASPRPELKAVTDEIKNVLVAKKLSDELTASRAQSKVEVR